MKVRIVQFSSGSGVSHILRIGKASLSFFELNSYIAKGRITRWAEKFLALLKNDGSSLCLHLDSCSSDGIPSDVYLGATKKQENIALYWGISIDGYSCFGWDKMVINDINEEAKLKSRSSLWQFTNPATAKKHLPNEGTISMKPK